MHLPGNETLQLMASDIRWRLGSVFTELIADRLDLLSAAADGFERVEVSIQLLSFRRCDFALTAFRVLSKKVEDVSLHVVRRSSGPIIHDPEQLLVGSLGLGEKWDWLVLAFG